jgi:hypothetical protein
MLWQLTVRTNRISSDRCNNFFMELALDSLDTTALTKAQLADALFDQLGLNKREAKDFVVLFLKWW